MLGLWFCLGKLKKLFNASIWSTTKGLSSPLLCFLGCSGKNNAEEILDGKKMNLFSHFQPFFEVGERVACASAGIFPSVCIRTSSKENKLVLEITVVVFLLLGFFFNFS